MRNLSGATIHCPRCMTIDVRASNIQTALDVILHSFLKVTALRCRSCAKRFHRKVTAVKRASQTQIAFEKHSDAGAQAGPGGSAARRAAY